MPRRAGAGPSPGRCPASGPRRRWERRTSCAVPSAPSEPVADLAAERRAIAPTADDDRVLDGERRPRAELDLDESLALATGQLLRRLRACHGRSRRGTSGDERGRALLQHVLTLGRAVVPGQRRPARRAASSAASSTHATSGTPRTGSPDTTVSWPTRARTASTAGASRTRRPRVGHDSAPRRPSCVSHHIPGLSAAAAHVSCAASERGYRERLGEGPSVHNRERHGAGCDGLREPQRRRRAIAPSRRPRRSAADGPRSRAARRRRRRSRPRRCVQPYRVTDRGRPARRSTAHTSEVTPSVTTPASTIAAQSRAAVPSPDETARPRPRRTAFPRREVRAAADGNAGLRAELRRNERRGRCGGDRRGRGGDQVPRQPLRRAVDPQTGEDGDGGARPTTSDHAANGHGVVTQEQERGEREQAAAEIARASISSGSYRRSRASGLRPRPGRRRRPVRARPTCYVSRSARP